MNCKKCKHLWYGYFSHIPSCGLTMLPITFMEERAKANNVPHFCPINKKRIYENTDKRAD